MDKLKVKKIFGPTTAQASAPSDTTAPTVTITSTESSPSYAATIPLTITFSEAVTGFVVGDITVSGCTLAGFATADNIVFTVNATPTANSITVDINAAVCKDTAGNDNEAATQFAITSMFYGLVMALNLNETSGNRADATGRGHTATQSGTVGSGTGKIGNAVTMTNSSANYLTVAYGADLALGNVSWWMSAWINTPTVGGWKSYICQNDAAAWQDWFIVNDNAAGNKWYISWTGGVDCQSTVAILANTWHNIQWGYIASETKMFISVDGETVVKVAKAGGITDNSKPLQIFKTFQGNGAPDNALIDRVYRYTTAWTPTLGAADYNSGSPKEVP